MQLLSYYLTVKEWTTYHLNLGISDIYLYDNAEEQYHLLEWTKRQQNPQLHYIDWYGPGKQMKAYQECARRAQEKKHK